MPRCVLSVVLLNLFSLFISLEVVNITSWDDGKKFEVQQLEVTSCNQSEGKLGIISSKRYYKIA